MLEGCIANDVDHIFFFDFVCALKSQIGLLYQHLLLLQTDPIGGESIQKHNCCHIVQTLLAASSRSPLTIFDQFLSQVFFSVVVKLILNELSYILVLFPGHVLLGVHSYILLDLEILNDLVPLKV